MNPLSTTARAHLLDIRHAVQAMTQAASDTATVADELRRYQKFARPGQPSPHIVQLRQAQARARHATNQAKQAFLKASTAFVRDAGLAVPPGTSLEAFVMAWLTANPGD